MPSTSGQALGPVDRLGGQLDELLRVALEVVQPAALGQDAPDAAPGELRLVLQVGQQVGQLDVAFVEATGADAAVSVGVDARLADGEVGLAPVQPGLGDRRARREWP